MSSQPHDGVNDHLSHMLESIPLAAALLNEREQVSWVNNEFTKMFRYSLQEVIGKGMHELIVPYGKPHIEVMELLRKCDGGKTVRFKKSFLRRDRRPITVSVWASPVMDGNRRTALQLTFARAREKRTHSGLEVFSDLFENHSDAVCVLNMNGSIVWSNRAFFKLTGMTSDELNGKSLRAMNFFCQERIWEAIEGQPSESLILPNVALRTRRRGWLSVHTELRMLKGLTDNDLKVLFLRHQPDIWEGIESNSEKDSLTRFLNREGLSRALEGLGFLQKPSGEMRIMVLEVKEASRLRKHLSFEAADRIIVKLADALRSADPVPDLIARTDSAQFAVCMVVSNTQADAKEFFINVQRRFLKAIEAENPECDFDIGAGMASFPVDGSSLSELFNSANMALERAWNQHENEAFEFNSDEMKDYIQEYKLQKALRKAMEKEELAVFYQPVFRSDNSWLQGFEALCRWHSPVFGSVPPSRFIPLAERDKQICYIGAWVLRTVCEQIRKWNDMGYADVCVSVNVSAIQLQQSDFTEMLKQVLLTYGVRGESLILEITESTQLQSTEELVNKLLSVRNAGVRISLDDFGTGYSSLAQLSRLPLTSLKVDRSFIWNLNENLSMMKAIVSMAQEIGLRTVAEGIETAEQLEAVREMGFDCCQGYWFARPMCSGDAELFMRSHFSTEASCSGRTPA